MTALQVPYPESPPLELDAALYRLSPTSSASDKPSYHMSLSSGDNELMKGYV